MVHKQEDPFVYHLRFRQLPNRPRLLPLLASAVAHSNTAFPSRPLSRSAYQRTYTNDEIAASGEWINAKFHCEQLLRDDYGVKTSGDGVQIVHDMMGRLFGAFYCTCTRMSNDIRMRPQRFQYQARRY